MTIAKELHQPCLAFGKRVPAPVGDHEREGAHVPCAPLEFDQCSVGEIVLDHMARHVFTGARLVKGFNHLVAAVLDQDPAVHGGRRAVFLASDDEGAAAEVGALAQTLGFAPIQLGGLSEGGLLVHARGKSWGQLIFKDLIAFDR